MKPLAEIFRFSIFLALIGAFVMVAFGVNAVTDYRSSNDIAGWVLIGLGVSYVILISPSAVLLVIMDDLREIRNHLKPNDKSTERARKSSYKISQQNEDLSAGDFARADRIKSEKSKNTETSDTSERRTPRLK